MSKWNNSNGMISTIWGPVIWHYLHTISFNYPVNPTQEQKRQYKDLIFSIGRTLPCKYCRQNFEKNIADVPLTAYALQNRNTFSRWMYRFHNHVNKMLGKHPTISYTEVRSKYNSYRASSCSEKKRDSDSKSKKKKECVSSQPKTCKLHIISG